MRSGESAAGESVARVGLGLVLLALATSPVGAQSMPMTVEYARADFERMDRTGGYWVTSNAAYATADSGEPEEYRMSFTAAPDGYSISGCMWGDPAPAEAPPFWRFFHAWDPTTESVLVYQSSPGGGVAIGSERIWADGGTEAIQTLLFPGTPETTVRHLNRVMDDGRLDSRSFDASPDAPDGWIARRAYVWEWRDSSEPTPC